MSHLDRRDDSFFLLPFAKPHIFSDHILINPTFIHSIKLREF